MSFFKGKRILVTGGAGFLGRRLIENLKRRGADDIFVPLIEEYDLRRRETVEKLFIEKRPQIVIHLAAVVGGIGLNRKYPGTLFYDNITMGVELLEQARLFGTEKLVALGTICAYPKFTPVPFKEESLWDGYPEETNAPYGLAKKMLLVQSQAYRAQFGFNSIFLLPVNLYGPGDNFDPKSSHVIPAIVKKCIDAAEKGEKSISVWGDGSPTREFLYVDDCAEAIALACEKYNKSDPVNIGSASEISIKELVKLISELAGFKGKIEWDKEKPGGQPRRLLDTSKALKEFGFKAQTALRDGLVETIKWYRQKRKETSSS